MRVTPDARLESRAMARIAVIGAGMGAMAAAARLATAGHRVEVYERTGTYGGSVGRFARDGFAFDTGPGLLHLPAVYRDLFVKTGRRPLEDAVQMRQVEPAARHLFPGGVRVDFPNSSRGKAIEALDGGLGPGVGERWAALMGKARDVWDATRRPLLEEPLRAGAPGPEVALRDPYPAPRRGLLRRRAPSFARTVLRELGDRRAAALLSAQVAGFGVDPASAPAGAVVLPYLEHTFGTWYVGGGLRALAEALHERCRERGVEFRFDAEVRTVHEAAGRAAGVELADGSTESSDLVIAAAPGPGHPADAPTAPARCTLLLALRGGRPAGTPHRTVVHRADSPDPVTVLRPDDPALRPDDDHEAAVLTAHVPAGRAPDPDALLAAADAAGLGLGPRVLWREVRTADDVAAQTGAPGGAVPGPALSGQPDARTNTAELPGLYRAGGWAHPGGGLAHAGMSGALVAGLIVEGDGWQGSY